LALGVTPLRVGQEAYWLDQIARDRCEYYSGKGESPGWWVGSLAERAGLQGEASEEAMHRLFAGQDSVTGEQRVAPVWRADPRSKLAAGPLQAALRELAAERGVEARELAGGERPRRELQAVLTARGKVGVAMVERICRTVLERNPEELYGEAFAEARKHADRRVDARVATFDLIRIARLPAKPLRASLTQSVAALRSSGYGERIFLMAASSYVPLSRPTGASLTR
jgi:TrwC relaxase